MLAIGNPLNFADLRELSRGGVGLSISDAAYAAIERGAAAVAEIVKRGEPAYGVNTGFGRLAQTHIPNEQLELLQSNLVLSHAVGVGDPLPAAVVRLTLALKIATLARGYSGVRRVLIDALVKLYNADVLPRIPSKGSVGASGDLAPLAHLSAVLLGVGEVECGGKIMTRRRGPEDGRAHAHQARRQGGSRAAQRHAGLHRARAGQSLRHRQPVCHGAGRGRAVGGCGGRLGESVRCAHPRAARPSGADRRGPGLSRVVSRQSHQLQPPRLRQGPGSLLAALPAAGHGRLQRPDRGGARGVAARSQCGHRQSAGVHRRGRPRRGALGRQLPRRARGLRG